jgi:hypothetical protein
MRAYIVPFPIKCALCGRQIPDRGWEQIRLANLIEDRPGKGVSAGLYGICPTKAGFVARFDYLTITPGCLVSNALPLDRLSFPVLTQPLGCVVTNSLPLHEFLAPSLLLLAVMGNEWILSS